jgi:hypothetical protein
MKKSLLLFLFIPFLSFNYFSQTNDLLKEFINKNELIIKSVHKQMYHEPTQADDVFLKKLLKSQLQAVALSSTNPDASAGYAYLVRKESVLFMKKHSKGNMDYYAITKEEDKNLRLIIPEKPDFNNLNSGLIEKVNNISITDASALNAFTISIR